VRQDRGKIQPILNSSFWPCSTSKRRYDETFDALADFPLVRGSSSRS